MAWRSKSATVLIVDVGRSMREPFAVSNDSKKVSKADIALSLARSFVQQKLFFMPKHEVGIVLFGTSGTDNDLEGDGYEHVTVARGRKIDVPDVECLKTLFAVPAEAAEEASDAVNALIVGLDLVIKKTRDLNYEKSIILITDEASAAADDPDLQECLKQLEATSTKLRVVVVSPQSASASPWAVLALQRGRTGCLEALGPATLAGELRLHVKPVEMRAKVKLSLILSDDMHIPIGIYSKTTSVRFPMLKKQSKTAAAIPEENRRTDKVIMDRTYHVTDDPDGEEVKKEDRVKGHKYGLSIVPMSEYDEAALTYTCDRTLTALGFAPASSVGPEQSMHHTELVAADKGDTWAYCAFEAVVGAMLEENRVLVARYCYRKDSQPRMVAMIPVRGQPGEASTMIMQYLPFVEDVREWTCASLPVVSEEQRQAVGGLIDSLSLCGGFEGGQPTSGELLRPEDTHNPALARFYDFLALRAVDPSATVLPPEPELQAIVTGPPASMAAHVEEAMPENERTRLKTLFPLVKNEKPVGGARGPTKRFWREAIAEKKKDAAKLGEVDTKKIKVDMGILAKKGEKKDEDEQREMVKGEGSQGADADAAGTAMPVEPPPRVHIGSVNPERDFERWLSLRRTGGVDTVVPAIEQMCDIIFRFAEEGEAFHGKALSCIAALRRGCVREAEAPGYNEFMRKLRGRLTKRQAQLWNMASADPKLGLITDEEVVTSTVSCAEARAFLAGEDTGPGSGPHSSGSAPAAGPPPTALSEKDLEAMIE
eukprot:TRINITY_DN23947_c0_g1_i1.p1 TRINITY_DN23947_c0_g1~~TRINITY_DN23947_c0_g1_i1.p1  ORF type:complete len:768 (+),score=195.19 TRINITY_DN23947_c0_g1_i1:108-2411(+)